MRRALVSVLALLAVAPAARAADDPYCNVAAPPKLGLTEVARKQVSARVLDLLVHSQAMQSDQHVDVLLPTGYDASRRYPVLYLLHGAFSTYHDWVDHGVEKLVGDRQMIVVMPDDGPDGSYSDWYGTLAGTSDPPPMWESYHVGELVPWIDAHFPTSGTRYVAGLSSGGGGAMKYAAEHPGLFAAAGGFSGAVDTDLSWPIYPATSELLWLATLIPGFGPDGHCTWGDFSTQQVIWRDNEATYKAENLRGTALFLASGDGTQGEYDASPTFDPTEWTVWQMNQSLVAALDGYGIPHTDFFYGHGTHTWPYWTRDLEHFLAWLHRGTPPKSFSFRSAHRTFSPWGWTFTPHRAVREFTYLSDVTRRGFEVTGSGTLDITTPWGRRLTVDLGPSHTEQQSDFGDHATDSWVHKRVVFGR